MPIMFARIDAVRALTAVTYLREMPVVIPSRELSPFLTGSGIPIQVVVPSFPAQLCYRERL